MQTDVSKIRYLFYSRFLLNSPDKKAIYVSLSDIARHVKEHYNIDGFEQRMLKHFRYRIKTKLQCKNDLVCLPNTDDYFVLWSWMAVAHWRIYKKLGNTNLSSFLYNVDDFYCVPDDPHRFTRYGIQVELIEYPQS